MDVVREESSISPKPIELPGSVESLNQSTSIDSILDTELTVENIDNYAENAFRKLVLFAIEKVEEFEKSQSTEGLNTSKEIEDAAFKYFGIGDISSVLDRIIAENDKIHNLDKVIARSKKTYGVIVPTNSGSNFQAGNNGEFKKPQTMNRLKSILYILERNYEVDTNDENQLSIIEGENTENMLRQSSYFMIDAQKLNRVILVCDEANNASYIFDSNVLNEKGISNDQLIALSKIELNSLLQATPEIGKRVVYSKAGFIPRVIDSINNPTSNQPDEIRPELYNSARLLKERMPEGYKSVHGIAVENDVYDPIIKKVIRDIESRPDYNNELETKYYLSGSIFTKGYSREQQDYIKSQIDRTPEIPEGYKSIRKFSEDIGLSYGTVDSFIKNKVLEEDYDGSLDADSYKCSSIITKCYSPKQQQQIIDYLNLAPSAPEGYMTIRSIAKENGVSVRTVSEIINKFKLDEGYNQEFETKIYKFRTGSFPGYSPEQQAKIIENIKNAPPAPEGYKSAYKIAFDNNLGKETVESAIRSIRATEEGKKILASKEYKFLSSISEGFSPEDQEIILSQINTSPAPEGYLTLSKLATTLGVDYDRLKDTVKMIKSSKGYNNELDVRKYKYFNNTTEAYSQEQQEYLKKYLDIAPPAPEGYISIGMFAKKIKMDHRSLKTTIEILKSNDDYNNELDINLYRFGMTTAYGLSPDQQQYILNNIGKRRARRL